MNKKIKIEISDIVSLDIDKFNKSSLTVKEMRYLLELLEKVRTKHNEYNLLMQGYSAIEKIEDPIQKITYMDDFLQRLERAAGVSNDELRTSIITKMKSVDIDFKKYFGL